MVFELGFRVVVCCLGIRVVGFGFRFQGFRVVKVPPHPRPPPPPPGFNTTHFFENGVRKNERPKNTMAK